VEATLSRIDALLGRFSGGSGAGIRTVYIGGGTPTALPRELLGRLLKGIAGRVEGILEWTLEANPESLDDEVLDLAEAAGVTRLSLGVQSLDDGLLAALGRLADSGHALAAIRLAAKRPGLDLSADLIAGLPRKTVLATEASTLVAEGVGHLSIYDITVEEGTRLAADVERGSIVLREGDEAWAERQEAESRLADLGFRRYEVSNYSSRGKESLHNLAYWRMDSWIGVGPGAVSTLQAAPVTLGPRGEQARALRLEEIKDPAAYADAGGSALETEIDALDSAFEHLLMGFRTVFGPDTAAFRDRFGADPAALIPATLASWKGHLAKAEALPSALAGPGPAPEPWIALDPSGLDLLNRFLVDCLSELERRFPEGRHREGSPVHKEA
jgi:oxygen-independent coproporphyrinogen-3 oxidase